ncbi:flagellar assembly protein FliH [Aliidiomarina sanyensis]|uniref:Flagellar assembly protein FliH n=1 Tax=Aliidiomarina sanyensis TaxID=1249555 RepID=A0A432WPT7_9GAMM|nr:flagellar assembly protein FliH [Aliidiomarina sanyensis]RUO35820.1 flagellar assembly protein FliH [Aliidiomarina sanyensis]
MFKPFSPQTEVRSRSERTETDILSGENWRRWRLDELKPENPALKAKISAESAARKAEFIRNAEIEALKEQARKEAYELAYQEGLKAGHDEGFEKGYEEAQAAVAAEKEQLIGQAVEPVKALASEFSLRMNKLDTLMGESLVELAMAVGVQLARCELDHKPEHVLNIVRDLLHSEPALTDKPRLYVSPHDLELIEQHLKEELHHAGWHLQADERLERGGCRLVSQKGERDASWETRSEAARQQIRKRHGAIEE